MFFFSDPSVKMPARKTMHYTTLSTNSKIALQNGNLTEMFAQLKTVILLWKKSTPVNKGPSHRHVIAFKQRIHQHMVQLSQLSDKATDMPNTDLPCSVSHDQGIDDSSKSPNLHSEKDTLSKRWMRYRKNQQLNTRKKAKTDDSFKEVIYKHYYQKLRKLTKMTVDPVNPSYVTRAKARSGGFPPEYDSLSYEEKFRILLYKVNTRWKPRDYVQRKFDFRSLFTRLCTNIMECIKKCTSNDKGDRLDSMDRLDNLFRMLRRFKISSPTFRQKRVLRGGGPKKRFKEDDMQVKYWSKRNEVGKDQLSVPVIDSLSNVLRKQFKLEYGFLNVGNLYKASCTSGSLLSRQKRFALKSVPIGKHAVQIHFCSNHYVTSEQKPSGIMVWDSLETSSQFKDELYPQLRLTYDILSEYHEAPKGLIKYVSDSNNMQKDNNSCGIYAVLRAYFISAKKSGKINTNIARSYLSSVLDKGLFSDYDKFSISVKSRVTSKMETMMENYMANQMELQSKKKKAAQSDSIGLVVQNVTGKGVKKRGRPKKYSSEEMAARIKMSKLKYYHMSSHKSNAIGSGQDTPDNTVKKPGRPTKFSSSEMKERIKKSKLTYYHKSSGKGSVIGRPKKNSNDERISKDHEKKLRYYHKTMKEGNTETLQKTKDRQKAQKQSIRENPSFREKERHKTKQHKREMRQNPAYREKERERIKQTLQEKRKNPVFRDTERNKDRERHKDTRTDPMKRRIENLKAFQRKYGANEQDAIRKYLTAIQTGPNVVCTSCLQLWFPDNCTALAKVKFPNPNRVLECKTGTLFEGEEWLCSTCIRHIKEDRIPPISHANGMKFYDIPEELALVQMEERCIALRQPFLQIRELPNGGQKSIKGNVVNVPMDVSKTINQLPRNLNETDTIGIKFKKKVSYKKCDFNENIRPNAVIKAAMYLINNSELYKAHNVRINGTWEQNIAHNTDEGLKEFVDTDYMNKLQTGNVSQDLPISDNNLPKQNGNSSLKTSEIDHKDKTQPINDRPSINMKGDGKLLLGDLPRQTNDSYPNPIEIDLTISDDEDNYCVCIEEETTIKHETVASKNRQCIQNNDSGIMINVGDINSNGDVTVESDGFSEIDERENFSGNLDTMLDSTVLVPSSFYQNNSHGVESTQSAEDNPQYNHTGHNSTSRAKLTDADALVIAPGEGQHPIALFNDPDAEYLAFPSIYCGNRRHIDSPSFRKTKKRPSNSDIFKWELRAKDRRVATCIPNIFFKVKSLQTAAVENVVGISVRKVQGKMQPTAGELKTPAGRDKLRNLHEGVNMFRKMRNTPPYYSSKKKNLLAMVRQGGMPALFFTQSCADTKWPELLKVLGKLVDNKDYTGQELEDMSPTERYRLVAADPVTVVRYFENKCHQFQKHIMTLRGSEKHFFRREFQHRGSPHSHEIHWIKDAPIYDPNNPENDGDVIKFIDSWIATEIEVQEEEKKYLKYQVHKHSKSCRKRGEAICRFGIPFFPMQETTILKPLEDGEVNEEQLQTLKELYLELRISLNEMGEGLDISHKQFLETIKMSETVYILAIRSSLNTPKVFYRRKPNALRVNPYMKGMLAVIKANHDVQFPLNIYALVCYVADYLLKSQKGLSATLEQACMDVLDGDMRLKQQVRHIGYKLLSTIETSAPEACYYIMQIPFTRCSVEVVFIPTSPPEDRTYVLKSEAELSELPENSRDVLKSNVIASYAKRPRELQFMCLADYVSELTVQYNKNKATKGIEKDNTGNVLDYDEYDEDIISSESYEESTLHEGIFPLKTKSATFKKRRHPRVIRFVNYNRTQDPENYCREKLLLYVPWRKEELLKGAYDTYVEAFTANEEVVKNNMQRYERFSERLKN